MTGGTLSRFVDSAGYARLRVACSPTDTPTFTHKSDLLTVAYS